MSNNSIDYEYNKRLALFELDMIKKEKEKLREKGYKLMDIPDAIAPELKDECYSKSLSMPRCDIEFYKDTLAVCKLASSAKDEIIKSLKEENSRLKELLKECRYAFKIYAREDETCGLDEENKYAEKLLTKIKEVKDA